MLFGFRVKLATQDCQEWMENKDWLDFPECQVNLAQGVCQGPRVHQECPVCLAPQDLPEHAPLPPGGGILALQDSEMMMTW